MRLHSQVQRSVGRLGGFRSEVINNRLGSVEIGIENGTHLMEKIGDARSHVSFRGVIAKFNREARDG